MSETLTHSWRMTQRHLMTLWRQPWYIAITIVQPIVWLILFGALFRKVVEIPGFGTDDYLVFLVPGIIVMSALFSNAWAGMTLINDLESGVIDRFLVTPVHRSSLLTGLVVMQAVTAVIQAILIVGIGLALGARFESGVVGVVVLVGVSVLLGVCVASFSNALALTIRKEESVIAASQFVILPATFISSTFMVLALAPGWIQTAAAANPVNWAVDAGRSAVGANPDWSVIGVRAAGLAVIAVLASALATRAFRTYQASV
jgi:ABC-2 type transport system permease protein